MGGGTMSLLTADHLCMSFRSAAASRTVLQDLSLTLADGERFVLLGESGCGKTTLLRCLAGFLTPDVGTVSMRGIACDAPSADRVMIFQSFDQLFPWFTLKENLLYAIKKTGGNMHQADAMVRTALADTGLQDYADDYPAALSGGMKQRGAIARALALNASLLLMDEPFSSLDYLSRQQMYQLLEDLQKKHGTTLLIVTHDVTEALSIGDRIAVFDKDLHRIGQIFTADRCDEQTLLNAYRKPNESHIVSSPVRDSGAIAAGPS